MADERSVPKKRARAGKATAEPEPTAEGLDGTAAEGVDPAAERSTGGGEATGGTAGRSPGIAPGAALGGASAAEGGGRGGASAAEGGGRGGIPVPFTGVRIAVPHVPLPSQHDVVVGAVRASNVVRENTPSADQLLYYGGLGVLAAFGVVDWPVAAAIGAGVWIARRHGGERQEAETRRAPEPGPHERDAAPGATPRREPVAVP
ncbi:hypothetical protein [Couchioplanes azureus]|uniref:hypothetical protein n=1 Tax=Couchioplanes caeruleus TaxID=56438 RepID=UPI00166F9C87|nr:hypothetical protein [Couchioplanes caeruleus]GGQ74949.1 hypothetical protein GCM10010166_51110 [Couchioplanes caeruleus subsp. azureus]